MARRRGRAVPGDFGEEVERDAFFEEDDADFAGVGGGGCADEAVGHCARLLLCLLG